MKILIPALISTLISISCTPRLTSNKVSALKKELEQMVVSDQVASGFPQGTKEQWTKFYDSVFSTNKVKVEKMFNKYGFLGIDKVGKDGSHNFWLLVQHSDKYPEFQRSVLKAMNKEVKKGNANPNNYAYLYDRVRINAGEKQLFGTQVVYEYETTGRAVPTIGLIDPQGVHELRKEYSLGPLKDYLNDMTRSHFEMNKERYEKRGITKPALY